MRVSMSICQEALPLLNFVPPGGSGLDMKALRCYPKKEKIVVVIGATGTGKSRLSIDLAKRFPAEIVNSDKMQVYEGLDIVTNKVTDEERCGVQHHLLGIADPDSDFTATDFRKLASSATNAIVDRRRLPIVVGGSNSYIEALIDDKDHEFRSRYECCFLWVDVSMPVLHSYISDRVDRMVEVGMISEVRNIFNLGNSDYSKGIRKAIGVPEFDRYFRSEGIADGETRARLLEEAINEIKLNTSKLACRQIQKIHRLRNVKRWEVHRLDATQALRKKGKEAEQAWEKQVAGPSAKIVHKFLGHNIYDDDANASSVVMGTASRIAMETAMAMAVVAATR